jgi:hypothetical protein
VADIKLPNLLSTATAASWSPKSGQKILSRIALEIAEDVQ